MARKRVITIETAVTFSRSVSFVKEKKASRVLRMKIVARLYDARVAMLGHRLSAASRRNIGATPEQVRGRPRTSKRHDAWCVDDDDDDEEDDDDDQGTCKLDQPSKTFVYFRESSLL